MLLGASTLCAVALTMVRAQKPMSALGGFFPLSAGTYWVYEGTVEWEEPEGDKPGSAEVTWKMKVERVMRKPGVVAAVVTGFPADLDWTAGTTEPKPWLIVEDEKHRVFFENLGPNFALASLNGDEHAFDKFMVDENLFFRWPVQPGEKFCDEEAKKREDGFYCWNVAEVTKQKVQTVTGVSSEERDVIRMEYGTLPDDQKIELTAGVGILSYRYHHHGTVADTDLRLVEFHSGEGGPTVLGQKP